MLLILVLKLERTIATVYEDSVVIIKWNFLDSEWGHLWKSWQFLGICEPHSITQEWNFVDAKQVSETCYSQDLIALYCLLSFFCRCCHRQVKHAPCFTLGQLLVLGRCRIFDNCQWYLIINPKMEGSYFLNHWN